MKTDGARYELERKANVARARLLGVIDELDRRRHEILDLKLQLKRHASDVISAAGGLLFGIGATLAVTLYRQSRYQRRVRKERFRALVRLWRHPEQIALHGSVAGAVARMALVALVAMGTTTFGARRLEKLRRRPRLPAPPTEAIGV